MRLVYWQVSAELREVSPELVASLKLPLGIVLANLLKTSI